MLLKILSIGAPELRAVTREISHAEALSASVQELIQLMTRTMRDAAGVGLAAPQVGVDLKLAIIEDREESHRTVAPDLLKERERAPVPLHVVINPRITVGTEYVDFFEGCLSVPGFMALVPRAREVTVECLDGRGEPRVIRASGWHARILQHEIDHLNGVEYIERMRPRSFMTADAWTRQWKDKPIVDARRYFGLDCR